MKKKNVVYKFERRIIVKKSNRRCPLMLIMLICGLGSPRINCGQGPKRSLGIIPIMSIYLMVYTHNWYCTKESFWSLIGGSSFMLIMLICGLGSPRINCGRVPFDSIH